MKFFTILFLLLSTACVSTKPTSHTPDVNPNPGQVSVIQTGTSENETSINVLRPIRARYQYQVKGSQSVQFEKVGTVSSKNHYWVVDQLHVKGLEPSKDYTLHVNNKRGEPVDWRKFRSLSINTQKEARFAMASCMSDAFRYRHVSDRMWDLLYQLDPNFIILTGDIIYVDSINKVSRTNVRSADIWQRYIESIRSLKVFNRRELKPILAVWDDHDYGTNNSDKNFVSKKTSETLFRALFGGVPVANTFSTSTAGVYKSFYGFGQRFYLMDNRYFREPQFSKKPYAHWGRKQHNWLVQNLKKNSRPAWIVNGGQFFMGPVRLPGEKKQINESLLADHPVHYESLITDLKTIKAPFVFASGDIHFSEILKIDDIFNFTTYELTASPMHAYIYRPHANRPNFWENKRRLVAHKDYNFFLITSRATPHGLDLDVASYGVKKEGAFFKEKLSVQRKSP